MNVFDPAPSIDILFASDPVCVNFKDVNHILEQSSYMYIMSGSK